VTDVRLIRPTDLARAYGIPAVIDYGPERKGRGLLVTTGAGMLMSDMDVLPYCRWAVDLGAGRHHPRAGDWVEACSHVTTHLVAHVWMSLTSPNWMSGVLSRYPYSRLAVLAYPRLPVGHRLEDMDEMIAWTPSA
jgi:hypothetical protein